MNRREFLGVLGGCALAAASPPGLPAWAEALVPQAGRAAFTPDVEFEMTARTGEHQILGSRPTQTWFYTGRLIKGRPGTLQPTGSYLGPTIRVRRGDKVRVHFLNQLPEPSIIHWHGIEVPESADGHPRLAIPQGKVYTYEFEVRNRAGQYWYHPHPMGRTAIQVYRGMAGFFFVEDDEETALKLPSAEHEIPIVLQDRLFDGNSQLVYNAESAMGAIMGFLGDKILVNGRASAELSLATTFYRLRILNGSNSRIYKLAWSDNSPVTIIGTDGGLLERAAAKPYLALAPGERADLILDLSRRPVGTTVELRSLTFTGTQSGMGMMGRGMARGMGRGMMGMNGMQSALDQGAEFPVLRIRVNRKEASSFRLPGRLSEPRFNRAADAVNRPSPRVLPIAFGQMRWMLNNDIFRMTEVAENEIVKSGSLEIWEFRNTGSGMMQMAHPMHVHGGQFQVIERVPVRGSEADQQTLRAGFTDEGWKDVVLVWPGERVRLLLRIGPYKGLFLYHCHNLEHEDMGLMRNYRIT